MTQKRHIIQDHGYFMVRTTTQSNVGPRNYIANQLFEFFLFAREFLIYLQELWLTSNKKFSKWEELCLCVLCHIYQNAIKNNFSSICIRSYSEKQNRVQILNTHSSVIFQLTEKSNDKVIFIVCIHLVMYMDEKSHHNLNQGL